MKKRNCGKTAHFKPETAFTDKVVVKVDAKTHLLLRRFSRLNPADDTESRKTAIRGYLLKAVMDAYNKYDLSEVKLPESLKRPWKSSLTACFSRIIIDYF